MRIVLEGTAEQIKNLKLLMESGDNDIYLPTIREDLQTANLWSVSDVQSTFDCTHKEAMDVLEEALDNEATMDQIWSSMIYRGGLKGLKAKS
jgi:hypothetical protein